MNRFSIALLGLLLASGAPLHAHGPAHRHSLPSEPGSAEEETHRHWSLTLESGPESRHIHYGVDETGGNGAWQNELTLRVERLHVSFWSGFGIGNDFRKYELSLAWEADAGPLFLMPGYRFRYQPGMVESGHGHTHRSASHSGDSHDAEHADSHEEAAEEDEEDTAAHLHKKHGHELFIAVGTRRIPYVVPSISALWDLNNTPGVYLEARLDGEVPIVGNHLVAEPYALLGVNLGYNTRNTYGWNHFQTGGHLRWKLHRHLSLYAGVHYSHPLEALRSIRQGTELWANTGVSLSY